jgi:hypothetical protein
MYRKLHFLSCKYVYRPATLPWTFPQQVTSADVPRASTASTVKSGSTRAGRRRASTEALAPSSDHPVSCAPVRPDLPVKTARSTSTTAPEVPAWTGPPASTSSTTTSATAIPVKVYLRNPTDGECRTTQHTKNRIDPIFWVMSYDTQMSNNMEFTTYMLYDTVHLCK